MSTKSTFKILNKASTLAVIAHLKSVGYTFYEAVANESDEQRAARYASEYKYMDINFSNKKVTACMSEGDTNITLEDIFNIQSVIHIVREIEGVCVDIDEKHIDIQGMKLSHNFIDALYILKYDFNIANHKKST